MIISRIKVELLKEPNDCYCASLNAISFFFCCCCVNAAQRLSASYCCSLLFFRVFCSAGSKEVVGVQTSLTSSESRRCASAGGGRGGMEGMDFNSASGRRVENSLAWKLLGSAATRQPVKSFSLPGSTPLF